MTALLVVGLAGQAPCQGDSARALHAQETAAYRRIAHRIFGRIVALKDTYPHLASIETAAAREEAKDTLWIAYHFTHGMSYVPNPNYIPGTKGGKTLKSFSPEDGIDLNLYFFEGPWIGQATVSPVAIGDMKIVTFVEGSETKTMAKLRRAIGRIIQEEKSAFEKHRHITAAKP